MADNVKGVYMNRLLILINQYRSQGDNLIEACHEALRELFPELSFRWARVYGRRWAYLYGDACETGLYSTHIQLNPKYGICIENADRVTTSLLEETVITLKECFAHEETVS